MNIERTANQILIKVSSKVDKYGMERVLEYIEYLEATSESKASQEDSDRLADELNENWWENNRNRFVK